MKLYEEPMQACIDACLACYRACLQAQMTHCLTVGGAHVEPAHFRLMTACAEMCRASAHILMTGSALHTHSCRACAAICEACADDCARLDGMEECVRACLACAERCREMQV